MALNKSFRRGQSTFTCRCCKRLTRDTGGEGGVELCAQCYELAGYENLIQDGYATEVDAADIREYFAKLIAKGVTAEAAYAAHDIAAKFAGLTAAPTLSKREAVLKGKRDRQKARRAARKA